VHPPHMEQAHSVLTGVSALAVLQCRTNRVSTFSANKFISNVSQGFGGAIKVNRYTRFRFTVLHQFRCSYPCHGTEGLLPDRLLTLGRSCTRLGRPTAAASPRFS
jgi:hypothetical protein